VIALCSGFGRAVKSTMSRTEIQYGEGADGETALLSDGAGAGSGAITDRAAEPGGLCCPAVFSRRLLASRSLLRPRLEGVWLVIARRGVIL
jgi:hypothetical protein